MKIALDYLKRAFPWLGLAIFLATPLWAIEMSNGPYRITRDDVNPSGQVLTDLGGNFVLTGSLGSVEAIEVSGGAFRVTPGLPKIIYYPDTIQVVHPASLSVSTISIAWSAPRGEVPPLNLGADSNYLAASTYTVKYSNFNPLDTDVAFEAASSAAQSLIPKGPTQPEYLEIPDLIANTSYYFAVRSYDGDRGGSYVSVGTACWTRANIPVLVDTDSATSPWTFASNGIGPVWLTKNTRPGIVTMTFDIEVATDKDFNTVVRSSHTTSSLAQATLFFPGLFQSVDYYFRVRTYNGSGVVTVWSNVKSAQIPVGLPTPKPFTGQDVMAVTANWWPNECAASLTYADCLTTMNATYPGWPNTAGPYYHAQLDTDDSFGTPYDSLTQRTTYFAFASPPLAPNLTPNTTYWARVQTVPEAPGGGPGAGAAYVKLDWTMTGVYRGTCAGGAGTYVAYTSSASFTWSEPTPVGVNGLNVFYYRVDVSTDPNFGGTVYTSTVPSTAPRATDIVGILPNTLYYARLVTMNHIMIPSVQGPDSFGSQRTHSNGPTNPAYSNVTDYQITMSWDHNGNNPEQTRYEVQVTSQPSGNFAAYNIDFITGYNTNSHTFTTPLQLLANTTYFGQVKALSDGGPAFDSAWLPFNSTTTRPTPASNMTFPTVSTGSININWSSVNPANTARNGDDTLYKASLTNPGSVVRDNVLGNSQLYNGLLPNTTYSFSVLAHSRTTWPDSALLNSSTSTLALTPINGAFSGLSDSGLTVSWANPVGPSNPPETAYRVELSTNQSFVPISVSSQAIALFTYAFPGLNSNATYYARVWSVNHCGAVSPDYLNVGSTVTWVRPPALADLQASSTSITILVNTNGNDSSTFYRFRQGGGATFPDTTLNAADANHIAPWYEITGLAINAPYDFYFSAVNRAGSPTIPEVQASTWTRAQPPPAMTPNILLGNSPITIAWNLDTGSNPNGPGPLVTTQYAIQAYQVLPDATPPNNQTGLYLKTSVPGGYFVLDGRNNETDIWKTRAQWGSVLISSGLMPGNVYYFNVYARNGDNGVGPNIPTAVYVSSLAAGTTRSDAPVIYLGEVPALTSRLGGTPDQYVWTSSTVIPFIARGAFNNYYDFSRSPTATFTKWTYLPNTPGWNGVWDSAAIRHDQPNGVTPASNYHGPLSGFHATGEGMWYLHLVGDNYVPPFMTIRSLDQTYMNEGFFRIFVDTTPADPLNLGLTAWSDSSRGFELLSGGETGSPTPYFEWHDPDGSPSDTVSPTVGYSYTFNTDASVVPEASTDIAVTPGSGWIANSGTLAVQESMGALVTSATYYFKIRSLDLAGNWSIRADFTYIFSRDYVNPGVVVDLGSNATVPSSQLSVAVSTTGVIHLYFNKRMNISNSSLSGIQLRAMNDNSGIPLGSPPGVGVPISFVAEGEVQNGVNRSTVTLTPTGGLQAGYRYLLTTDRNVRDTANNPVTPSVNKYFYTLMNPTQRNVVLSCVVNASTPPASVSQISFDIGTWSGGFAGLAVNEAPTTQPMAAPAIAGLISRANRANNNRNTGGYGQPFVVHEFNLYDHQAVRMGGAFGRAATITMSYNDANGDGVVDESESTQKPVKVAALGIYWLDDDTGVWVRLPTSRVDPVTRTVSAQIVHFSVYGLLGAPELSLANAYAYPVPYKPSMHANGIRFKNLSSIGTIKIYTVNGELVNTLTIPDPGGNLTWNPVVNSAGDPVASGVYIYVIENPQERKTGKIMVVR